ncbi:sigma-70 family RNA polymerase sigma factor [Catenuloplanes atrovinosus]|uniref:RNA polymerase sigma factor n=1 Tax=Catenuloplanes atrovinosus TaxID=137266 RepID=A0AAE3YIQ9_9ACTN|nr:sigma-70 family RNA polymerase sigma factor [Catenuloplanes atrovinosus]MDR7274235.1 RNA polymerase sigma-70 factor (ECF subfamily) [Catenuloplanes atrovinosus]
MSGQEAPVPAAHDEDPGPDAAELSPEERMRLIHEAHSGPVLRFLTRLTLGDQDLAEDLLQEAMLRAWRNIDVLPRDTARVAPWLFTVARNVAIDAARARKARPPEIVLADISRLPEPSDAVDGMVAGHIVRQALEQLSPDHRAVLIEVYFRGASTAEAAARLGIPEGTVKSRAYYAVRSMRSAVGSVEPE